MKLTIQCNLHCIYSCGGVSRALGGGGMPNFSQGGIALPIGLYPLCPSLTIYNPAKNQTSPSYCGRDKVRCMIVSTYDPCENHISIEKVYLPTDQAILQLDYWKKSLVNPTQDYSCGKLVETYPRSEIHTLRSPKPNPQP